MISGAYSIRKNPLYGLKPLAAGALDNYFYTDKTDGHEDFLSDRIKRNRHSLAEAQEDSQGVTPMAS